MGQFQDVTVKVPTDRLAEFYEWFGRWLEAPPAPKEAGKTGPPVTSWNPPLDLDLAVEAWARFPDRARTLLSTLVDNPERRYWSEQLAQLHGIANGKYGIAGSLAWPGRTLRSLGKPLPIESEPDPRGGSTYWMTPALASLFATARRRYDEAQPR